MPDFIMFNNKLINSNFIKEITFEKEKEFSICGFTISIYFEYGVETESFQEDEELNFNYRREQIKRLLGAKEC